MLPYRNETSISYLLSGPSSNAYQSVRIMLSGGRWEWPGQRKGMLAYDRAEVRLLHLTGAERVMRVTLQGTDQAPAPFAVPAPAPASVAVGSATTMPTPPPLSLPSRPATLPTRMAIRAGPASPDNILQWMSSIGLDATNEQIVAEAAAISDELQSVFHGYTAQGVFSRSTVVAGSGFRGRPKWMLGTWVALCLAIWLLGVRRLARRRGTPLEAEAAALPIKAV